MILLITTEISLIVILIISLLSLITSLVMLFKIKVNKTNKIDDLKIDNLIAVTKELNNKVLEIIKINNENLSNYMTSNIDNFNKNIVDIQKRIEFTNMANEQRLNNISSIIDNNLTKIQENNSAKLEEMRKTVDEKLNISLQTRLSQSFSLINERLEAVYKGLGEMQTLANGVGDLRNVLKNIKTRGTWGEVQLGNLLEQMLSSSQYLSNINTIPNSLDRVEFAIKMPGKDNQEILLPIDAKFPLEDYERLISASEIGNVEEVERCKKALEKRIKEEAKKINEKYICIPYTTDFAIMYLPIEGLFAEVVKIIGLTDYIQTNYKIMVCGPTTLTALVNSLQMGFKTLAIEKRSNEIWNLLASFKSEFGKFIDLLTKTQKKLQEASNTIESATKSSIKIEKKLKDVTILDGEEIIKIDGNLDE